MFFSHFFSNALTFFFHPRSLFFFHTRSLFFFFFFQFLFSSSPTTPPTLNPFHPHPLSSLFFWKAAITSQSMHENQHYEKMYCDALNNRNKTSIKLCAETISMEKLTLITKTTIFSKGNGKTHRSGRKQSHATTTNSTPVSSASLILDGLSFEHTNGAEMGICCFRRGDALKMR